jgi:hypothetical protein
MIRGKAAGLDGQEDPLTALVFGLMAWVPPSLGLEPLLAGAVDDHRRPLGWGQELSDVSIDFWPWWDEHDHVDGAEPDAVLTWTRGGRRELLVVEAKWKAGKSGTGERDQLMRQYANARILADQEHLFFRGLLYVTAGVTVPVNDLRASREALQRAGTDRLGDDVNLGWVSWRDLPPILTRAASELTATDSSPDWRRTPGSGCSGTASTGFVDCRRSCPSPGWRSTVVLVPRFPLSYPRSPHSG